MMHSGIKSKLIISLLLANGLLAFGMYWMISQSFDKGFLAYVNQTEAQKLEPFINALSQTYARHGDWNWIQQNHKEWRALIDKHVFGESEGANQQSLNEISEQRRPPPGGFEDNSFRPPPEFNKDFQRPPPPEMNGRFRGPPRQQRPSRNDQSTPTTQRFRPPPRRHSGPLTIDTHFLVRDDNKAIILGPPNKGAEAMWLPIKYQNNVVGELGIMPRNAISEKLDVIFVEQQKQIFAYIAYALVVIAVSVAVLLAGHFLGPIKVMSKGMRKLVAGDYEQNFNVKTKDELGQLAADFNILARTLKENRQSRRQWIADISHELRTPVAILQGELEAMLDGVRKVNRGAITSLQQEAQRLGHLISDLHELSMSDLGALSYNKEQLDIVELLEDFIESNESRSNDTGIQIHFKSAVKELVIFADGDRFDQLFKNLLQNTLRYTDAPGKLDIDLKLSKNSIEILWEDSAPGVSESDLTKLFDRLYRVDDSRNRAKGGAGLGMSICKNIVVAHDGDISLYHASAGGLGIKIKLPI
jgi:two-component system, OmpR family, sensor histidine kinase BaeS